MISARLKGLVRTAMEEGALGVASALIYPPGSFAETDELVALAEVRVDDVVVTDDRDFHTPVSTEAALL